MCPQVKLGSQLANTTANARRTTWVTDAAYLPDASMLLFTASDRSLHVYSATGLVHVPTYHISGANYQFNLILYYFSNSCLIELYFYKKKEVLVERTLDKSYIL